MKKMLGLVEGFYGTPWNPDKREVVLRRLSDIGFNTYIYAPKDDKYHRSLWKESYPKAEFHQLVSLFNLCKGINLDFYYTLSPGGEISYSSEDDFTTLVNKYFRMYKEGIRHFGLFLDDIAFNLPEGEDKSRFGTLAKAQNYFVKKVYKELVSIDKDITFSTCPTLYHGRGDEEYIVEFSKGLPQEIYLFWTGREVCSQVLSAPDGDLFESLTGHRLTYWDNYPVNDSVMRSELHLGPYDKRDSNIVDSSDGIVLNPMELPLSSLISLETIADFFRSSETYEKEDSWNRAVEKNLPEDLWDSYKFFASFCYKSCIYPYFSNKKLMSYFMENIHNKEWDCGKFLYNYGTQGLSHFKKLVDSDSSIVKEALPWIYKFEKLMKLFTLYKNKDGLVGSFRYKRALNKFYLDDKDIFQLEVFKEIDSKFVQ